MNSLFRSGFILLCLFGGLACSSAQYRWQHPVAESSSFEQIKKECQALAGEHASKQDTYYYDDHFFHGGVGFSSHGHHSAFGLYGFGYDPYFDQRQEYFKVCMKAKGWERVKINSKKNPT